MKITSLVLFFSVAAFNFAAQTQDTNIQAVLREIHDAAKWGFPTTNGIQLGVAVFSEKKNVTKFDTVVYLYDTNFIYGLIYPPHGSRLDLSLRNPDGKDVEKTKRGKSISNQMSVLMKNKLLAKAELNMENKSSFLATGEVLRYDDPFNILDTFKVEKAGIYTLTVGTTIYKLKPDRGAFEIVIPTVSIPVPITQADLDLYHASKEGAQ